MAERDRRILERAGIRHVSRAPSAVVDRSDFIASPTSPVEPPPAPRLKTMMMIFSNPVPVANMGLGQQWNIPDIITSPCLKGFNWEMYQALLLNRGFPAGAFIETTDGGVPAFQVGGTPYGDAVCCLASSADYVALGNYPSGNVIQRIRDWAVIRGRPVPKVGLYFVNIESIAQRKELSEAGDILRVGIRDGFVLAGTGPNLYGCNAVDQSELSGSPFITGGTATIGGAGGDGAAAFTGGAVTKASGPVANVYTMTANAAYTTVTIGTGFSVALAGFTLSYNGLFTTPTGPVACPSANAPSTGTHTWYADVLDAVTFPSSFASAFDFFVDQQYPVGARPDFCIIDNCADQPFFNTATNEPIVTAAQYKDFWKAHMASFQSLVPLERWVNRGEVGITTYTQADCPARYGEFFLHLNADPLQNTSQALLTIKLALEQAHQNNIKFALNSRRRTGSAEVELWQTAGGPGGVRGTWAEILEYVTDNNYQETSIAVALRTSSGFYGMWQPEFGTL